MTLPLNPQRVSVDSISKIKELSGENIKACMQCGTCTVACPMAEEMDFFPRKVMHFSQFGMLSRMEDINSYWKCASCHSCSVRCPRGIDIAKVMESLRLLVLRTNKNYIEPSQIPKEKLKEYPGIMMVAGFRKLTS
ncbi:MAG: 4Fe-4S dicluster domain-containing protein [Desulfocapsaceae bacterium]|nr:4Fe-4S dicluster domain-containing protein [Desulfocapsaceae bacterium]